MEIGSFIEIDLKKNNEYYPGSIDIARLNSARTGIYHALRLLNSKNIYLPYYLCSVVRDYLLKKGIDIHYYNLSNGFEPILEKNASDTAILIVNYFGILSNPNIVKLCNRYHNVIVDNCQAFYSKPVKGCYNVYSARKFFGVPDGSYVIGANAQKLMNEYEQDYSSNTADFLFKRIEYGSSPVYDERMSNEDRINKSETLKMSALTLALLKNIDYELVKNKRKQNFIYAHKIFNSLNIINPTEFIDSESIPMVYPLVVEDSTIERKLNKEMIYTGRWWNHVLSEVNEETYEAKLSKFMLPIPIDQRYSPSILDYIKSKLTTHLT